jgi:periplasmic divalent cation tolerance protein
VGPLLIEGMITVFDFRFMFNSKILVMCSLDDPILAEDIANALIMNKLAACVQLLPRVTSIYWWDQKVKKNSEILLLAKTEKKRFADIELVIKQLHPYTCPEILGIPLSKINQEYAEWITSCCVG